MTVDLQEGNSLVEVFNNQTVVSSLSIAEHFGKEHYHVMRDIQKLISELGTLDIGDEVMFKKIRFLCDQNGQEYPMYVMTKDGFLLFAMKFTGKKYLKQKLEYIKAFREVQEILDLAKQQELGRIIERMSWTNDE